MSISAYYNYDRLLSYNAVYNIVAGARGLGKTYGAKERAIKDALNKGRQFIYLRRYKDELTVAKNTFFTDIEHKFPEWEFRVNGYEAQASKLSTKNDKKRDWITLGFFLKLVNAQNYKSVAFTNVYTIIFDEFIIEKGAIQYLPNEANVFNNFYSTIDRYKDRVKVFFLANAVTIMNPYFIEWDIKPDEEKDIVVRNDRFIVAHFPDSELFKSQVYETRFGKFIKNTEYENYAVGNKFADNHDRLLKSKNYKAKYLFTLECETGSFSVWYDMPSDEYFIQSKLPKNQDIYTLVPYNVDTNKILLKYNDKPIQYLRTAFRTGKINFDSAKSRNTFTEIFKK